MEKEFIPYEQALALKELGFDEECLMYWNDYGKQAISRLQLLNRIDSWCINYIEAPTFSQAFRWFREKHDLLAYTTPAPNYIKGESKHKTRFSYEIFGINEKSSSTIFRTISNLINVSNYEEAELECLKKLIEIVKK